MSQHPKIGNKIIIRQDYPNRETLKAISETEEIAKHPERYKTYTDVDEMFRDILA